ncbi:MAG: hypothetical protein A2946_03915 [Candidatus Liptonbacteria bacterium RIFCSPLOWO2_01_FULL_53_13]|uniref:Uncharacterized protein n=1 Tax=Candidatus Liptonbacteria bacterium RIFCSPLOWO2_01_FULL_53_13 TaxID=1798651 RepID=A0A1G2CJG8_9BACT|nr:MAG: hypothetical protein A2946_03915 [Candidatus Liptonbacteria bacterium RIFCSPLOWO2_01_FULL_53_13]
MNSETKNCQNCKSEFTIEPDDFAFYEMMKVPPPTWCPRCRLIRRMAWRGYQKLHKRKCDSTGEQVISVIHPNAPYRVYRQDFWWSDKWDPKSYGKDYDFSKSFFVQFEELLKQVPLPALFTEYTTMVDSDYCNAAATLRNCYLCFNADTSENCAYLNTIEGMKECFDVSFANFNELCYQSVNINKCYKTFYSVDCEECQDVYFSRDCIGCTNCVGCVGLRKKSYHILNQPYTKEEYEKVLAQYDFGSRKSVTDFRIKADAFALKFPRKAFRGRKNERSSGDCLWNCKNVRDSYMVTNGENVRYSQLLKAGPVANAYDYTTFAMNAEQIYECCWVGIQVNNIKFGFWDYKSHDLEYSFGCHGSGNLFGCIGVRGAEYCILNKQYSKEEYVDLVTRIKKQMAEVPYQDKKGREYRYGEYFPSELSPWAYNETNVMDWFPISKAEALAQGFLWRNPDVREYLPATAGLPDHIRDAEDGILKEIFQCTACGKNYRVISMELDFYRHFQIPIPAKCSFCRDNERRVQLNPIAFYDRICAKCSEAIKTTYAPDRPEIVYCEQCYQAEVA